MTTELDQRMQAAIERGDVSPLEAALANWAERHGGSLPVAVALASCARAVSEGHSCLSLQDDLLAIPGDSLVFDSEELNNALRESDLVGTPGQPRPLILEGQRLYLHRYWHYEHILAERLRKLMASPPQTIDSSRLDSAEGVFNDNRAENESTHWQAVAAFVALRHRFAIIAGGPGTGKTYTVLRLMRLLIEPALANDKAPPVIQLAAPTGKAAARMIESIRSGLQEMKLPGDLDTLIPKEAKTLHRLIGVRPSTTHPLYDSTNPLAADVVIIDEASMVDLPMMAKVVDALPDHARLILLGDPYQLASVESGSVLIDLCNPTGPANAFTREQLRAAGTLLKSPVTATDDPLADHVVTLQTTHRFSVESPIGRLAAAVNRGDTDALLSIAAKSAPVIILHGHVTDERINTLVSDFADRAVSLASAKSPESALAALQARCLLCAVRRGPAGSETLNQRITGALAGRLGLDPGHAWYQGRPVIVTRNDTRAGLFNGDIGICLADDTGRFRVYFYVDGRIRGFLPTALPEHETMYAMTVHKSQGSEFSHVTLILPTEESPILSRELLYTGVTRARQTLTLIGDEALFRTAAATPLRRYSGLAERLRVG